jgi:transcriptional antiterminator RfaH
MPILSGEISLHPSGLLEADPRTEGDRIWSVVYTKSRQEKAVARELLKSDTPFYLPLIPTDRVISGRRFRSLLPLFSGYLFQCGSIEQNFQTQLSSRVSQVLPVPDPEQLCRDLSYVQRLIEADSPLSQESRLSPGDRVRVKHGSLQGLEGTIIRREKTTRLLIAVSYLQQGVSVQIDDFMVEPL